MRKIIFLFLLLVPLSVNAACSNSNLSRYKALTSHIGYYYDHNGSSFDLTFYNVSSDFIIVNKSNGSEYRVGSNMGDVVVNGLSSGNVDFAIYPIEDSCRDYRIYTFSIILPHLNKYFNDPICLNNNSSLCSKWANTEIYSQEQFREAVAKESAVTEEINPEKEMHKYGFFDFLTDYYMIILLVIIAGGSIGIYFLDKKSKFDFSVS